MTVNVVMKKPFNSFKDICCDENYVDRSEIIEHLNMVMGTEDKYVCVTTKKSSGKTCMADMIAAYYSNSIDSSRVFNNLKISETNDYEKNLNSHNVIHLSMIPRRTDIAIFDRYICAIEEKTIKGLKGLFKDVKVSINNTLRNNLNKIHLRTGERFVLVIDDWDYILCHDVFEEKDVRSYLKFLAELIIDADYLNLVYLSGKSPVSRYTDMRYLNIFNEFTLETEEYDDTNRQVSGF